ncbi:MAG: serine/threonine protein kinase [Deltaproteobacteria bacterium]|nr:serine/threonine protein kinase [Deltaproteobacteria bacterium]
MRPSPPRPRVEPRDDDATERVELPEFGDRSDDEVDRYGAPPSIEVPASRTVGRSLPPLPEDAMTDPSGYLPPSHEGASGVDDLGPDLLEDPLVGTVVGGRYKVVRPLGEGGMGMVYLAEHTTLRRTVALKTIRPELAADGELAARFAREAMAAGAIDHPHVASALDYGELPNGGAYLVMHFARGIQLRDELENRGPMPWTRACHIAVQIADALDAAHASGIIHRDLKPDNVMVETRKDGIDHVRVLDFGIARVTMDPNQPDASLRPLTKVGTVMGTPGYMSPEQAVGERIDARADLYALGCLLYEMVTGAVPFGDDDVGKVLTRQMTETPRPLAQAADDPGIPEALQALVTSLLSTSPKERPRSAAAVAESLRTILDHAPHARTGRSPSTPPPPPRSPSGPTPVVKPPAVRAVAEAERDHVFDADATTLDHGRGKLALRPSLVALGCGGLALVTAVIALVAHLLLGGSRAPEPSAPEPTESLDVPAGSP